MKNITKFQSNLRIRKARKTDEFKIKKMLYYAIHIPAGSKLLKKSIVKKPEISMYYENWGRKGDSGYIVESRGKTIAAIWIRFFNNNEKGYGFINEKIPELSMAVKKKYRNNGLGTILLKKVFEDFRKPVSLSVNNDNRAVNLYKRHGFSIYSESIDSYIMIKEENKQL